MLIHCYFNKNIGNLILIYAQEEESIVKTIMNYLICH